MIELNMAFMTGFIALIGAAAGFIWWVHRIMARFEALEKKADHRKKDSIMLLKGIQVCLNGLKQGGANGVVTEMEQELLEYIRESR